MKYPVSGRYTRREPVGFVPFDVEYEVEGTYYPGYRATRDDPAEPPEVELTKAVRIDPFSEEREVIPFERWPFSTDEEAEIQDLLLAAGD